MCGCVHLEVVMKTKNSLENLKTQPLEEFSTIKIAIKCIKQANYESLNIKVEN